MKKCAGFMLIALLPFLCVVHLLFLLVCLPLLVIAAFLNAVVGAIRELFDVRNLVQFVKGVANKAYKLTQTKET